MTKPRTDARSQQLILDTTSAHAEARATIIQAAMLFTSQLQAGPLNLHIRAMILRTFDQGTRHGATAVEAVTWSMKDLKAFHQVSESTMTKIVAAAVGSGMVRKSGDGRSANQYTIDVDAARQWLHRTSDSRPPVAATFDRDDNDDAPPDRAVVIRPPGVATQRLGVAGQGLDVATQPLSARTRVRDSSCFQEVSNPPPPDREDQAAAGLDIAACGTSIAGVGSADTRAAPQPESSSVPTRPVRPRGTPGWSHDERQRALAALKAAGITLLDLAVAEARQRGVTADELVAICAEYRANAKRFRSNGAIVFRVRHGAWPAEGVRSTADAEAARERTAAKRSRGELETRLFVIVNERRAAGDDDDTIRERLAEVLPIEFLREEGWA